MMEPRIIPQEQTKIGDIAGKTFKRTLVKGEELRRTSIINSGFIRRVGLDQKNLDQLSNLYIVSGEPNYISAQVGILKLLEKKSYELFLMKQLIIVLFYAKNIFHF